jgi:hypothetical protein
MASGLARSTFRAWGPPHRSLHGFDLGLLEEFYSEAMGRIPTTAARSFQPTIKPSKEVKT